VHILKGHSCSTQLLEFVHEITDILNGGDSADVVLLDLSKAFDTVPHARLLRKLRGFGIRGDLFSWLSSFLTGRSQYVAVDGHNSAVSTVISGVPQGSVIGPLLFLIYVDDIDSVVSNSVKKFADDTKLYGRIGNGTVDEDSASLQADIDSLGNWATTWQMRFNSAKCNVLHVGNRNQHCDYYMGADKLESVTEARDLGVWMTADLKFSKHCGKVAATAHRQLGMIKRTIVSRDKNVLIPLYRSLVRPHVDYCSSVWSPYQAKDKVTIERVQRRFTRLFPAIRHLEPILTPARH
jgi:ribonuclease P/MRP protein subunit RPP40